MRQARVIYLVVFFFVLGIVLSTCLAQTVRAACYPIPVESYSPTGIAGCEVYGEGLASWWSGPGVARNDCVYPWTACQTIRITSLATGRSIVVTPTMFCDCYTGTSDERIVDLDPRAVQALGLKADQGLFPVRVEPAGVVSPPAPPDSMPDAAMRSP